MNEWLRFVVIVFTLSICSAGMSQYLKRHIIPEIRMPKVYAAEDAPLRRLQPIPPLPPFWQNPVFAELANEIVYDNWAINYGVDLLFNQTVTQVSDGWGYFGAGVASSSFGNTTSLGNFTEVEINTGWGDRAFSGSVDRLDLEGGIGYTSGNYGVRVDRDLDDFATAVEVAMRAFESGTVVDNLDVDYGQRIRVRNFEISIRHDFFDMQDPAVGDVGELATEIFVGYKSFGVSIGTDFFDAEYGVSVGLRGREFSFLRDFDENENDFQGNWGRGWQMIINSDFIDPFSSEIYGRFGFGRLGKAFISAGAGIGREGIPQAAFQVESRRFAIGFDFIDDFGDRLLLYSISVGKFTYVWESTLLPQNIFLPT